MHFFIIRVEWWNNYGDEGPHLQKGVIKILSQTCSSSSCEKKLEHMVIDSHKVAQLFDNEKVS